MSAGSLSGSVSGRVRGVVALLVLVGIATILSCGSGDDDAGSADIAVGEAPADDQGNDEPGGADGDEGADEADGASAADGSTDSPDGAGDAEDGSSSAVDSSLEVPEWVEVVGIDEALNVRAGPSSSFDRVAQVPPGETLRVLGGAESDEGGLWLQVIFGGDTEGWVFAQYTSQIARPTPTPLPTPTPVGTPTPLPADDGGGEGGGAELRVVAPDGLNLRDAPGLDTEVIAELDDGDRVQATGRTDTADGRDWTEVRVDGRTGWVASEFVR